MQADTTTQDRTTAGGQTAPVRGRFVSAARVFTGLTAISRVCGFARDISIGAVLGLGGFNAADCFSIGFTVPNLFRRLFGEGALSSALVPVLTDYEHSPDPAVRQRGIELIQSVATLMTLALAAITLLVELGLLSYYLGWSDSERSRLVSGLTAVMMPYVMLVCLVAVMSAVLNVRGRFAEGAASPIILNVCQIAAALLIGRRMVPDHAAFVIAGSVVLAGVLQVLMIGRALRARGIPLRFRADWKHPGVRQIAMLMGPMVIPLAVVSINTLVDKLIAWTFVAANGRDAYHVLGLTIPRFLDPGAVAAIDYAAHLYEMPLGIFSVAIATAIFPALARHASDKDHAGLADTLRRGIEMSLLLAIPATVGLVILRDDMVSLIQWGRFRPADVPVVSWTMTCFVLGLSAFSTQQLLIRAFYALKQVRTPVIVGLWMVALNLPLNVALVVAFRHVAGLALSTTICATVQSAVLAAILRRRLGRMGWRRLAGAVLRTLLAAGCMGVAVLLVHRFTRDWFAAGDRPVAGFIQFAAAMTWRLGRLFLPIAAGMAVFYAVSRVLKIDALRELVSREE